MEESQNSKIPIYLYENMDSEIFQDYFNNLSRKDKKLVLESILDYEVKEEPRNPTRRQNQSWLEETYRDLLKEVGFLDNASVSPDYT